MEARLSEHSANQRRMEAKIDKLLAVLETNFKKNNSEDTTGQKTFPTIQTEEERALWLDLIQQKDLRNELVSFHYSN